MAIIYLVDKSQLFSYFLAKIYPVDKYEFVAENWIVLPFDLIFEKNVKKARIYLPGKTQPKVKLGPKRTSH